jgi:uncharacterized membrane protein
MPPARARSRRGAAGQAVTAPRSDTKPDRTAAEARPKARRASATPWIWPAGVILALAGVGISAYQTITGLSGAPPVCLAGDCAAVAASPYAWFLGLPTAALGLTAYVAVAAGSAATAWWRVRPAWLPTAILGLSVFGLTFSLYLLWVQVGVLGAVCSWCAASDVLWALLVGVSLAGALRNA